MTNGPPQGETPSLWDRLRRRKVVQWGLLYVAGAWGFLQGVEYLSETFDWPQQLRQISVLVLLIGLPIVLVVAWYHGDRGEQRVRGTELLIVTLLFLAGGGIFWLYDRAGESSSLEGTAATESVAGSSAPVALPAPDAKSIAVLPFADMSAAKDQEYMSDGIAEELLNLLAKAPDLRVIARTSSFAFKGKDVDIAEIATRLNVAHVLEGSVRTSGKRIRITAQLIRAGDSMHLWSETYDRPLDDIFALQDEIAQAIAQALQIRLMGGALSRQDGGTQNLDAYQLYLRSVSAHKQNTATSLKAEEEYLERALKLDPAYGRAWLALAGNVGLRTDNGFLDPKVGYPRVQQLAQHALELSPGLAAEVHSWLQFVYQADWNWAAADLEGRQALALDPTNPEVLSGMGILSRMLGRWDDAEQYFQKALVRDPVGPFLLWNLGTTYYLAGRFAEAEAFFRQLLGVEPSFGWARTNLGMTLLAQGNAEEALAVVEQNVDEAERLVFLPAALHAVGRRVEAEAALSAQIERWGDSGAVFVAQSYAYRGDHDLALQWLERAYDQKEPALVEMIHDPAFKGLAGDPRFRAFVQKMNVPGKV